WSLRAATAISTASLRTNAGGDNGVDGESGKSHGGNGETGLTENGRLAPLLVQNGSKRSGTSRPHSVSPASPLAPCDPVPSVPFVSSETSDAITTRLHQDDRCDSGFDRCRWSPFARCVRTGRRACGGSRGDRDRQRS